MINLFKTILIVLAMAGRRIGTRGVGRNDEYNMIGNARAESDG